MALGRLVVPPILAEEIESLRSLTSAELLELKRFVDEPYGPLQSTEPIMDRDAKIAKAEQEVLNAYDSLLSELAK